MISREYRLVYNEYNGTGWKEYKRDKDLIVIIKSLGVLQAVHPTWKVKVEARTISEWDAVEVK